MPNFIFGDQINGSPIRVSNERNLNFTAVPLSTQPIDRVEQWLGPPKNTNSVIMDVISRSPGGQVSEGGLWSGTVRLEKKYRGKVQVSILRWASQAVGPKKNRSIMFGAGGSVEGRQRGRGMVCARVKWKGGDKECVMTKKKSAK